MNEKDDGHQLEDISEQINKFLNYCRIDEDLTDKQKLRFLKEKKMQLEVDSDICYDIASKTESVALQLNHLKRMEANEMAIRELDICINYLYNIIKENSFSTKIKKKFKEKGKNN